MNIDNIKNSDKFFIALDWIKNNKCKAKCESNINNICCDINGIKNCYNYIK